MSQTRQKARTDAQGCPLASTVACTHTHHKHAFKIFLKIIFVFLAQKRDQEVAKVWRQMREKLNKGKHFFFFSC